MNLLSYKGYTAAVEFDADDLLLTGRIAGINDVVKSMQEISTTIAAAVEEQGAATSEIVRNVQQAADGTGRVTASIGDVTSAARDTGATASQVLSAATDLTHQSTQLRAEVERFLATLRAA